MNKFTIALLCGALLALNSCNKSEKDPTQQELWAKTTSSQAINNFALVVASPNYSELKAKAEVLKNAVATLNTTTTDANLQAAQTAWREARASWEQTEAFLIGPADEQSYDPAMDTWPLNKVSLDSLLASSNALTVNDIDAPDFNFSLKGFHAIEYVLFGTGGTRKASELNDRLKLYLASLSQSLYNTTSALAAGWDINDNASFATEIMEASSTSPRFKTRQEVLLMLVNAMAGICDEVANGKMQDPLTANGTPDSLLCESNFAHNSTADFRNNMKGVANVYYGKYIVDGTGLNELIGGKKISLHNTLVNQINAAVNSFNAIDPSYEKAIYTQQVQIKNAQDAINALKETLETEVVEFIQLNVKD